MFKERFSLLSGPPPQTFPTRTPNSSQDTLVASPPSISPIRKHSGAQWRTIGLILSLSLAGVIFALAHHAFNLWLNGKAVATSAEWRFANARHGKVLQEDALRVGNVLGASQIFLKFWL